METTINTELRRATWNKGRLIGQRPPLKQKEVWAIQIRLQLAHQIHDLALFNRVGSRCLRHPFDASHQGNLDLPAY